jgi:hypothetical protein
VEPPTTDEPTRTDAAGVIQRVRRKTLSQREAVELLLLSVRQINVKKRIMLKHSGASSHDSRPTHLLVSQRQRSELENFLDME